MASTENVTCPFCSLLCDDLTVRRKRGRVEVSANACTLGRKGFSAPPPASGASLKGVPAPAGQAVKCAASLLKKSRRPLIGGIGTDVEGVRAALRLAEKTDAALLHSQENHAMQHLKALQSRGAIMTTLAEVKNRADTIIFVGNNVTGSYRRFIERCVTAPCSLFVDGKRKLGYLGRPGRSELKECNDPAPVIISGRNEEIADNLALLRAWLADRQLPDSRKIPAAKNRKLKQLAAMIREAQYGVLVWSPAALPGDHADLVISSLLDLLRDLNAGQRFAGLSLGGDNGGATWQSVATWQTGFPAAIEFRGGRPSGNGSHLADIDCLLWISGFAHAAPPALDAPVIILSPYSTGTGDADVYIPVGVPGIDHTGNLFRTDGIINLPLKKLRDCNIPSAAEIMGEIISVIEGRRRRQSI